MSMLMRLTIDDITLIQAIRTYELLGNERGTLLGRHFDHIQ